MPGRPRRCVGSPRGRRRGGAARRGGGRAAPRAGSDRPRPGQPARDHFARGAQGLVRLVQRPPSTLSRLVTTRRDPPWPLVRLRLAGLVAEIRAADLAFRADEAAELFTQLRVDVTGPQLQRLVERTEGWAAGLRLAAVHLKAVRRRRGGRQRLLRRRPQRGRLPADRGARPAATRAGRRSWRRSASSTSSAPSSPTRSAEDVTVPGSSPTSRRRTCSCRPWASPAAGIGCTG